MSAMLSLPGGNGSERPNEMPAMLSVPVGERSVILLSIAQSPRNSIVGGRGRSVGSS